MAQHAAVCVFDLDHTLVSSPLDMKAVGREMEAFVRGRGLPLPRRELRWSGPELFAFVRGHNMAKAGIEMAILDLFGKAQNKPIWQILGGERTEIPTGVSLGIEDTVPDLIQRVEQALSKGYQRIKLKIKRCIRGRFHTVWVGNASVKSDGTFQGTLPPRRAGYYFARAYYEGATTVKSDKQYFKST